MVRLRVLISTPEKPYPPTQLLPVNLATPTSIKTPGFEGEISVWVKDYAGDEKRGEGEEYFGQEGRGGMTYAIVTRGRFLDPVDADDLVFGNMFEKPIKSQLPWGSSIAIKAMHFLDPTLEVDVYGEKPWALSPTLATFNYLSLTAKKPEYTPSILEKSVERLGELYDGPSPPPGEGMAESAEQAARKKWLGNKDHRKAVTLDKSTWVGMEFCNGYLDFNTLSAKLPPPFNLSFPLLQYWDGQPVTYVCKKRAPPGSKDQTDGEVYFAVAFEIVDEEAKQLLAEKEGHGEAGPAAVVPTTGSKGANGDGRKEDEDSDEEGTFEDAETGDLSDDVD